MDKLSLISGLLLATFQTSAAFELTQEEVSKYNYTVDFNECIDVAKGKSNKVCKISRVGNRSNAELNLIVDAFVEKYGEKTSEERLEMMPTKDTFCLTNKGVIGCGNWEGYVNTKAFFDSFNKGKKQ